MPNFKYHVFLSHSSPDKPSVEELAVRLKAEGLEPWLDKWNLVPGEAWQQALEDALASSASCAVFIGPGGFGAWEGEEMRAAISRRVSDGERRFRVIPVLLPMTERPDRGKLPTFLVATTWVEFRKSLDDAEAFRRLVCGIRGIEPGTGDGPAPLEGRCPYRGLEAFDVEHASAFFGREAMTEWLVDAIRSRPDGREHRLLAILGASGSGKSSLARAGLIAALQRGALEGSASWPSIILKPGRDPIEGLAVALSGLGGAAPTPAAVQATIAALKSDEKTLHLTARLALRDAPTTSRLVVLVDQCEEAFTLCRDDDARRAFFDNLLYAATVADGRVIVVLTMRADFYGKCAVHPALAAAMSDNQLLVGPMTEDELRSAIERPAALAGGDFEPGLVEVLLQDVDGQPGALPLLQFALMELWDHREGRRLTVAAYKALGELQGALSNRADEVFNRLDAAQKEICRRIFLGLTQPGEGSEDAKRLASFDELVPAGADPAAVEAVVGRLADARLIIVESDPKAKAEGSGSPPASASVEVAHEALIRGWARLRQWIDADRVGLRIHRQIAEAAREWQAGGRRWSFLPSGPRLEIALEWARGHADQVDAREKAFLDARRRLRLLGRIAAVASVVLVVAALLAAREWAHWQDEADFRKRSGAVEAAMDLAANLANESNWRAAITTLDGVRDQIRPGARYDHLREEVDKALASYRVKEGEQEDADRDRRFLGELAEAQVRGWGVKGISLGAQANGDGPDPEAVDGEGDPEAAGAPFDSQAIVDDFDPRVIVDGYRETFCNYDLDVDQLGTSAVVERIRKKAPEVQRELAAVLDDWAGRVGPPEDARLRGIAMEVDLDPWRVAIRKAVQDKDVAALKRRAEDPGVLRQPAITFLLLGSALAQAREYAAAVRVLVEAQRQYPADFPINMTLAQTSMRARPPRYDEATRYYAIAVALKPQSPGANSYLGFAFAGLKRFDDTIFYTTRAIALDPTSSLAYHFRANAQNQEHKYDEAIADCSKAIELDPKDTFAYSNRGAAWLAKRHYEKAIADFSRDIELNPRSIGSYVNRGLARAALRQDVEAIADYDKAIAVGGQASPTDRDVELAYRDRAEAHMRRREYRKAIDDYTEAIRRAPDDSIAYYRRGIARGIEHEYRPALADYDAAIERNPNYVQAYASRAWLLATCPEEAIRDGRRAIESARHACDLSHWKLPLFIDGLAAASAESGDFDAAVKWEKQALSMRIRHSGAAALRRNFEHRLELYQARKPFRTPGLQTATRRPRAAP